jgi:hypothetical protein
MTWAGLRSITPPQRFAVAPISVMNSHRFMLVSDLTGGSIPPSEKHPQT